MTEFSTWLKDEEDVTQEGMCYTFSNIANIANISEAYFCDNFEATSWQYEIETPGATYMVTIEQKAPQRGN